MTRGESGAQPVCPRCGSSVILALRAVEHESCGAIKPAAEFRTGDGVRCPDCGVACDDVRLVSEGSPVTCADCGHNFESRRRSPIDGSACRHEPTAVLEDVRSRLTATSPVPHRFFQGVLVVSVLVLLVSATMLATFAPSLPRSEGIEPENGPAAGGTATEPERTVTGNASWASYQSIVIFRNDDVQPNYRPETRRAVDRVFVEEDVPVTQAVVPVTRDEGLPDGFCRSLRKQTREHPDTFEYALHGYSHEQRTDFHGGSEFGGLPAGRQATLIRNGTAALRTCLQRTPTTFVPPFNSYDDATASALADEGYAVVSGGTRFTAAHYGEAGVFERNGILHLPESQSFVRNWSTTEFHTQSHLEAAFDDAYRDGEVYVQTLHYQTFSTESKRDHLRGLIDHMQSKDDVAFMTVGEFARKYERGAIERTDDGWRVLESPDSGPGPSGQWAVDWGAEDEPRVDGRGGSADE